MSKLEGKSTISDCWWDIFNIKHTLSYTFLSARCTDLIQKCVLNYLRFILWFSKYWKIRSSFQLNSRYHRYLKTGKWWAMGDLSVILFLVSLAVLLSKWFCTAVVLILFIFLTNKLQKNHCITNQYSSDTNYGQTKAKSLIFAAIIQIDIKIDIIKA